ncbi:hypothetical protein [Nocardioides sp.]|uniref:hypothetical protein n=1 Tax=Nocardioides sp. TaxID=35761 RepID=UPI0035293CA1
MTATESSAVPTDTSATGDAALEVRGLWKIFGPKAGSIIGTPDANLSRKELQGRPATWWASATSPSTSCRARSSS